MDAVCPAGTVCFTSTHFLYGLVVVAIGIMYWIHTHREQTSQLQHRLHNVSQQMATYETQLQTLQTKTETQARSPPSPPELAYGVSATESIRQLMNPIAPPLRLSSYRQLQSVHTRGPSSGYIQMGVLMEDIPEGGTEGSTREKKMIPLYGEETYRGSNRYRYFTETDGFRSVKLPIQFKSRDCLEDQGCETIYDTDNVNVSGFTHPFKATIYKMEPIRYNPNVI